MHQPAGVQVLERTEQLKGDVDLVRVGGEQPAPLRLGDVDARRWQREEEVDAIAARPRAEQRQEVGVVGVALVHDLAEGALRVGGVSRGGPISTGIEFTTVKGLWQSYLRILTF